MAKSQVQHKSSKVKCPQKVAVAESPSWDSGRGLMVKSLPLMNCCEGLELDFMVVVVSEILNKLAWLTHEVRLGKDGSCPGP